jgi:hypothetical protein
MAKIFSREGELPKRIDDFIIYKLGDDMIIRNKSGFTSRGNLSSSKYVLTRMNAHEFGRVSSLCKCIRMALKEVLPKRNNLAVVNAFTKKMRAVMTLDEVSERGERNLGCAFKNDSARKVMTDYAFNPDGLFRLSYTCADDIIILVNSIVFFETICTLGFRIHVLGLDFEPVRLELVSSDWNFYTKKYLPEEIVLKRPVLSTDFSVGFVIVEVGYFEFEEGSYLPLEDDRGKVVQVLECF